MWEQVFDRCHLAVNTVILYVSTYHSELFLLQQSQSNLYIVQLLFNLGSIKRLDIWSVLCVWHPVWFTTAG